MSFMFQEFSKFFSSFLPESIAVLVAPLLFLAACVIAAAVIGITLVKKGKMKKTTFTFYSFIAPWLLGLLIFTLYPVIFSLVISFTKWDIVNPMKFVGFDNYIKAFSGADKWFYQSLKVTFQYTFLSVPLQLVLGFLVAVLMNQKIPGMRFFRTVYYLPSLVSGVALAALWKYMFNFNFGLLNGILEAIGLPAQQWLNDPKLVIPSLVFMSLWGIGGNMVIYLAGLQGIPKELYEAAAIDGASTMQKMFKITLPQMSSVIFFNLIMGIIGSFQVFTQAYTMTSGGPNGASMFYMLNLYDQAFKKFNMGYASALAWILFVIILFLTSFVFRSSNLWVYYESETKKKNKKRKSLKGAVRNA